MAVPQTFPDRSLWLRLFGCIEILIAAFLGFASAGVGVVAILGFPGGVGEAPGLSLPPGILGPAAFLYGVLSVLFLSIGIGTLRGRRWARTLMLQMSWLWLAAGALAMVQWLLLLPGLIDPETPSAVLVVLTLIVGLAYVGLPAVFVVFLRSASVRATVEGHDSGPSWTERVPPSVLSMVLALAAAAVLSVAAVPWDAPFFGRSLHGLPAALVWLGSGAIFAWLAVAFYRLRRAGWWGTLAFSALWTLIAIWAPAGADVASTLGPIQGSVPGGRAALLCLSVLAEVAVILGLVYAWRYFCADPARRH